ncbi:porin [Zoogloea sp.]|uniref:porin n=1 Tax=Zoogloea sp. TaxID=49181 RepID=UPI0025E07B08|nr:porin [Zoogloea sp.]MCK6395421.1 OprO/OprP family phosphate-selective porin [Zoogloea sp.]
MKTTPICLALAMLFSAGTSHAATDAKLLARIERMAAELEAVKAELKTVKAEAAARQAAPAAVSAPATAVAATPAAAPAPAPHAAAPIEMAQAAAPAPYQSPLSPSGSQTTFFGYGEINYNRPFRDQSQTQLDVRRAVIGIAHQASERTRIVGEFEFEHSVTSASDAGEVAVEQLYVEHRLTDNVNAKGGLFLIPLGFLNLNHEPTAYYGVERNFVETAIIPSTWREVGLSAFGVSDAGLRWDVGLTSGFNLNKWDGASSEGKESPLAAIHQEGQLARANNLSAYGALSWRGTPGLDVGAGLFSGKLAHKVKTPSDMEANAAGLYAPDARLTLWDAHARWTPGKWDLSALYARGTITDTAGFNERLAGTNLVPKSFFGWYTQAAYKLWENGEYALSPFARYEVFNTAASFAALPAGLGVDADRDEKVVTTGANLRIGSNVVLKADVQRFQVARARDRLNLGIGYQF